MPEIIGEYVDRLCTVEMRPCRSKSPRGVMHKLYQAARDHHGRPLTLSAAEALIQRVDTGDAVFMVTGAGAFPTLPHGEVDGFLGSAE